MKKPVKYKRAITRKRKAASASPTANQVRKAAQRYGKRAIESLWAIGQSASTDSARIAALKEILDRGFGKDGRSTPDSEPALIRRIERIIVDPED